MKPKSIKFKNFSFVNPKIDKLIYDINRTIKENRVGKNREDRFKNLPIILAPILKRHELTFYENSICLNKNNLPILFIMEISLYVDISNVNPLDNAQYLFRPLIKNKTNETLFKYINRIEGLTISGNYNFYGEWE